MTGVAAKTGRKPADIRILVVEDDLHTRDTIMRGLRAQGYDVRGAVDGLQALHHLQRERFSVVVTDIQMPRMDGIALLREIRRHGYAPVVVQTTVVDPYLRDLLERAGASGVLMKDEPLSELVRLVEAVCRTAEDPTSPNV